MNTEVNVAQGTASLTVHPVSGALGAEVFGVDLADLGEAQWNKLHDLWLEHLVLFFPDQHLSADDQIALARRLGVPEVHAYTPKLDDDHLELTVLDTVKTDEWHTDVTFSAVPPIASVLQMITSPGTGGDTIWTNQYLAYERLSDPLRELVTGLTAVHTAWPMGQPDVCATHPVVRTHPETGRRALFVNRGFTTRIVELHRAESDMLLEHLFRWSEQPGFQCRYRWSEGTIAIWDNRCTQHFGVSDYRERRVLHRVTVLGGDAPFGEPARWAPAPADSREDKRPL